ncbi:MAG: phage holin family protein [Saprospirales bacterium]|nr:phage holin family protein [Saprospirales bacterium]
MSFLLATSWQSSSGWSLPDWITGIRAAVKRKEPILAAKMGKTIEKTALYFIALLLSEGMRRTFFPAFPITYITALSISITEFKSNIENIESVTGVNLWIYLKDHLSTLLKKK